MNDLEQVTYFADTDARNRRIRFGIKAKDRTRHVYVIGKTGMGKSTLLENMAVQDIRNGNGFAFIDPHGKTADLLLEYVPKERIDDVLYFAPFDMDYPISFNVMEDVGYDKRHLVVSGLMSTFKKIWVDAWSARMEYILGNTLLALLEYPGATLLEVNRMLSDKAFRNRVVENISDASVKSFWTDEFAKYTDRFAAEATPAIQNKIGQFTSNPLIRNIIGQAKSSFDLRKLMDERKIVIINLSKGRIGEQNANLLGSMLITKIYLSALSRADIPERELEKLPNFYLYVDEFQSFANESFANILSEARKYKLNLTIAHQYIEQMSEEVRAAVFGNVGTLITFRVGSYDAEVLEKEFAPTFEAQDIVNLGAYQTYLRLMIDGIGSKPFSAASMPPLEKPEVESVAEIRDSSRRRFAQNRTEVEKSVSARLLTGEENGQIRSGRDNQGGAGGQNRSSGQNQSGGKNYSGSQNQSGGQNLSGGQNRSGVSMNLHNSARFNGDKSGGRGINNGRGRGGDDGGVRVRGGAYTNNSQQPRRQNKVISDELKAQLDAALADDSKQDGDLDQVSLKDLAKKTENINSNKSIDKSPTPQNKNSLKEALSAVMNTASSQEEQKKAHTPKSPPLKSQSQPSENKKQHSLNEISEKDLKDVLGLR